MTIKELAQKIYDDSRIKFQNVSNIQFTHCENIAEEFLIHAVEHLYDENMILCCMEDINLI